MNIHSTAIAAIDTCFEDFFLSNKPPGLIYAITHRGRVIHVKSFGIRSAVQGRPMERHTMSRIASMTKSFATVAALRLRDAGRLDIDSPISGILKGSLLSEPFSSASLRDLMAMKLDLVTDDPWADRLLDASDEEIEPYFAQPLLRAGLGSSRCAYSNLSYFLLGKIIAVVSGRPAMEYISEEILKPLGMSATVWNVPQSLRDEVAIGYRTDCDSMREERYFVCRSNSVVFGGLWSSVDDLAMWLEFLRAADASQEGWESVLSMKSRRELSMPYSAYGTKPHESTITGDVIESSATYGFGIARVTISGEETLSHSGGIPGYGSHMRVDCKSGYGMVGLANGTYCPVSIPCASSLSYLISDASSTASVGTNRVVKIGSRLAEFFLAGPENPDETLFTLNFWQDNLPDIFLPNLRAVLLKLGADVKITGIICRSGYQGEIVFSGANGKKKMEFRLAPHVPERIQYVAWAD